MDKYLTKSSLQFLLLWFPVFGACVQQAMVEGESLASYFSGFSAVVVSAV